MSETFLTLDYEPQNNLIMKIFTFIFCLLTLALGAGAQVRNHPHRSLTENQEALSALAGERATEAVLRLFSSGMQLPPATLAPKALAATITLDSIIDTRREPGTQSWENDWKTSFQYNASLQLTALVDEVWQEDPGQWAPHARTDLSYDDHGQITQMLMHSLDNQEEALLPETRMNAYYDDDQRLDSLLVYDAEGEDSWMLTMRQYNTYGSGGLLEQIDMEVYDEDEGGWIDGLYIRFTYDDSGRRTSYVMSVSDEDTGQEFPYSQTEYTYNDQGLLTLVEHSAISFVSFEMEPDYKTEYIYGASGERTRAIDYDWVDGTWEEDYMEEFTYDPDLDMDEVVNPYLMFSLLYEVVQAEMETSHVVIATEGYEHLDGQFVWTDYSAFFYSEESTTGIAEAADVAAGIYPNPAREHIVPSWDSGQESLTLEIYQVTGVRMLHREVTPGMPVSVGHLNRGLYLYRLVDDGRVVHAGKLLKQ